MKHRIVHLFFHDDIDGIVSAAMIMSAFFTNHVYRLYPVKSSIRGDKFNSLIDGMEIVDDDVVIIVDYQYHERANIWVDHHFNSDLGNNEVGAGKIFYNSKAKSAARIIYNWFESDPLLKGMVNQHIVDIVDMIDSAGYSSVDYIFSSNEPLMMLKAYLERLSIFVDSTYCRIVELIHHYDFNIEKVLFAIGIDAKIVSDLKNSAKTIEKVMIINGAMSVTDMNRLYAYPRYAEYLVKPDLVYSIRVVHLGGDRVHMDVGFNKWQGRSCSTDIGKLLGSLDYPFSGGGHPTVGGAIIRESDCERFIDDMCVHFNNPEGSMEKYGVDKNDAVEKEADKLVKTGEVKTKDEAREKAISDKKGDASENVQSGDI